jgi:hypothetical protein
MYKKILVQYIDEIRSSYYSLTDHITTFASDEEHDDLYEHTERLKWEIENISNYINKLKA